MECFFKPGLLNGVFNAYVKLKLQHDGTSSDSNFVCCDILVECLLLRGTQEHKCMDSEGSAATDRELPAWIRLAADTIAQSLGEAADCDMSHGCRMTYFDRIETMTM